MSTSNNLATSIINRINTYYDCNQSNYVLNISNYFANTFSTLPSQWKNRSGAIFYEGSNVGIGTNSPSSNFHIHTNIGINNPTIGLQLTNGFTGSQLSNGLVLSSVSGNGYLWNYFNCNLIFGTNNVERLRIDRIGNIGVKNYNPQYSLDISGDINVTGEIRKNGNIFSSKLSLNDYTNYLSFSNVRIYNNSIQVQKSLDNYNVRYEFIQDKLFIDTSGSNNNLINTQATYEYNERDSLFFVSNSYAISTSNILIDSKNNFSISGWIKLNSTNNNTLVNLKSTTSKYPRSFFPVIGVNPGGVRYIYTFTDANNITIRATNYLADQYAFTYERPITMLFSENAAGPTGATSWQDSTAYWNQTTGVFNLTTVYVKDSSYNGQWFMIDIGESITLSFYRIHTFSTFYSPVNFRLYASTDSNAFNDTSHSSWTVISDVNEFYNWPTQYAYEYDIYYYADPNKMYVDFKIVNQTTSYRYFAFVVNKIYLISGWFASCLRLKRFIFYGKDNNNNNISINNDSNNIYFNITNPLYNTKSVIYTYPYIVNKWYNFIWNIRYIEQGDGQTSYIRINYGDKYNYSVDALYPEYQNILGSNINLGTFNIADYSITSTYINNKDSILYKPYSLVAYDTDVTNLSNYVYNKQDKFNLSAAFQYYYGALNSVWGYNASRKTIFNSFGVFPDAINVGIGTSLATCNLHLHGSSSALGIRLTNNTTNTGAANGMALDLCTNDARLINYTSTGKLSFWTNALERITLLSSGQLGIGTTAPTSNVHLHLNDAGTLTAFGLKITNTTTGTTKDNGLSLDITGNNARLMNFQEGDIALGTNGLDRVRILRSGEVAIGTATPTCNLHIHTDATNNNNATVGIRLTNANTGTGTTSGLTLQSVRGDGQLWNYYNCNLIFGTNNAERLRIDNLGNVGIGTASVSCNLHIHTTAINNNNATVGIRLTNADTGTGTTSGLALQSIKGDGQLWNYYNCNLIFGTNNVERLRIDNLGNVGIGTASVSCNLHIHTTAINNNNATVGIRLTNADTGISTTSGLALQSIKGDGQLWNYYNCNLIFGTNNAERLRIDNLGNVGIGTITPTCNLHLHSTITPSAFGIRLTNSTTNTGLANGMALDLCTNDARLINYTPTGKLALFTNALERVTLLSSGQLGIGTTAPTSNLHLHLNDAGTSTAFGLKITNTTTGTTKHNGLSLDITGNNARLMNFQAGKLALGTNGIDEITILSTGNVGINNTNPQNQLDVTGDINFTGNLKQNGNPFSTAQAWTSNITGSTAFIWYNGAGVGIGSITSTHKLHVEGNMYANGFVYAAQDIIAAYSDVRLKRNISQITNPVSKIMNIQTFKYKPNELAIKLNNIDNVHKDKVSIGVSAQDVQKEFPEIVHLAPFDSSNLHDGKLVSKSGSNYLTISYEKMVPILLECIKELKKEINHLTNEVNNLKSNQTSTYT
jgi:hypothetical protein